MDNQQHYGLTSDQIQVILTGTLGDGCVVVNSTKTKAYFQGSSIVESLAQYKFKLLGNLGTDKVKLMDNIGYRKGVIYKYISRTDEAIYTIHTLPLERKIELMTDLGVALWIYDDGSLHQKKQFYNINSHSIPLKDQISVLIPFLEDKYNIRAKISYDTKKDGKSFPYLRIGRHNGSKVIAELLQSYPVRDMMYKSWCSQTIQEWSKLEAELKSDGKQLAHRGFTDVLNRRLQDIVESA